MARIRTIKPEFWTHEDLSELPEATHMLAAALLNHADDEGYFNAHPGLVKAACCPLREPSVSIQDSLKLLAEIGFIRLGTGGDGKRYGRILTFDDHQRVNRPTPSKIKAIGIVWEDSSTTHAQLSEPSPPEGNREGKGTGKGREQGSSSLRSESSTAAPSTDLLGDQPPPADLKAARAQRLAQVARDAIETFNESKLVKTNEGLLANVSPTVGWEKRQQQVQRCIRVAREICVADYNSQTITREFWVDYWGHCAADPHKSGRAGGGKDHPNWKPSFEYLTREGTMLEVYDRVANEDAA